MTGAKAHDPRQFTISTENMPSSVVSPGSIPNSRLRPVARFTEPRMWQAVPLQILMMCLPFGFKDSAL